MARRYEVSRRVIYRCEVGDSTKTPQRCHVAKAGPCEGQAQTTGGAQEPPAEQGAAVSG